MAPRRRWLPALRWTALVRAVLAGSALIIVIAALGVEPLEPPAARWTSLAVLITGWLVAGALVGSVATPLLHGAAAGLGTTVLALAGGRLVDVARGDGAGFDNGPTAVAVSAVCATLVGVTGALMADAVHRRRRRRLATTISDRSGPTLGDG